jgi:hypothetical protein
MGYRTEGARSEHESEREGDRNMSTSTSTSTSVIGVGNRVKTAIKNPDDYAHGAAACLDDTYGTVEEIRAESMNGKGGRGPAVLVRFDIPRPVWWKNQTPASAFWFPPSDLVKV